jgi:hypothetical protein
MMFLLFAAASVASVHEDAVRSTPKAPVAQARATVRIVSGVVLRLDSRTNPGAPPAHDGKVVIEGGERPAQLIEFE